MIAFFNGLLTCLSAFFRSRYHLSLEILALRQQLGILKRKQPHLVSLRRMGGLHHRYEWQQVA
jgi:hypothetical protein